MDSDGYSLVAEVAAGGIDMGAEICGGGSNGSCGNRLAVEFAFGNARMPDSLVAVGGGGFKPISRNAVEEEAVASETLSKTAVVEESRWILPAAAEMR